jgi:hypothetical protein
LPPWKPAVSASVTVWCATSIETTLSWSSSAVRWPSPFASRAICGALSTVPLSHSTSGEYLASAVEPGFTTSGGNPFGADTMWSGAKSTVPSKWTLPAASFHARWVAAEPAAFPSLRERLTPSCFARALLEVSKIT